MTTEGKDWLGKNTTEGQRGKPYAAPKLVVHGSAERITQYGGGQEADVQMGSMLELAPK